MSTDLSIDVRKEFCNRMNSQRYGICTNSQRALEYYISLTKEQQQEIIGIPAFVEAVRVAYNSQNGRPVDRVNRRLLERVLSTLTKEQRARYLN